MSKPKISLNWLEHIELKPEQGLTGLLVAKTLRHQLLEKLEAQDAEPGDLERCVYIIRMTGDFVISYPKDRSPVLYIGRGSAFTRISAHLKNWLYEIDRFGKDVRIEIRVCRPRRKKLAEMFKYVEADLIAQFANRYGCIPFFNSRWETSYEDAVEYTDTDRKQLSAAIGVGRGKRPRWAIAPAPANRNYDVYHTGHYEE